MKEAAEKKAIIKSIRDNMAFFGFDLSDLSDEELEEGFIYVSEQIGNYGVTGKEAADALFCLQRVGK